MTRLDHIIRFYELLAELEARTGGKRLLGECNGRLPWPARGVYFFFEPGETRSDSGTGSRVTRVGTHGVSGKRTSELWPRLRQHRGTVALSGNHRSSRFRLLVGLALKKGGALDPLSSWGLEQDRGRAALRLSTTNEAIKAAEAELETKVSEYLGKLPFLCLPVENDPNGTSARGMIERNSIALLSNFDKPPIDPVSVNWLGRTCPSGRIAKAELWNDDFVESSYDPAFLDIFKRHLPA